MRVTERIEQLERDVLQLEKKVAALEKARKEETAGKTEASRTGTRKRKAPATES